ncbi:type III pantothenate kinase [Pseudoalteromonas agarivorans]|uniref:type III pantothenate kinase n=1 Tax=Pseudoalteromonas agarivorans TaxID=176102 RepID=UPI00311FF70B
MRLLIDVGNTSLKAVLWQNQQAQPANINNLPWQHITEVVYACVGKSELMAEVLAQASTHGVPSFEASVTKQLGKLSCAYDHVGNLGIDRWLVLIAGFTLYPDTPCIVVDAGTATTIDVLADNGVHLGGWILPGLDLMTTSLTQNTQRVFDDGTTPFEDKLGKNTPNGLKNGALAATVGAIEQAKRHLAQHNCSQLPKIIFAGGYGALLQQQFTGSIFDSLLVMKGLNYWRDLSKHGQKV